MKNAYDFNRAGDCGRVSTFLSSALLVCVAVMSALPLQLFGSHSSGSDIRYRYIGGLKYELEVSFYRDCGGVSEPSSISINCMSTAAGHSQNITAQKVGNAANGQEVTVPCAGSPTQCNGGVSGGIRQWIYRATVTLPSRQADWVFSYTVCCRNCVITTISSPCAANSLLYVEATLDNLNVLSNSSPRFSRLPLAYVCTGQAFRYSHGAVDTDGDSLVYELIAPKTTRNSNVNFLAPYSASQPMASNPPLILDPVTGEFVLSPAQIQVGVMAIRVKEYRQGLLVGSVIRDMQIHSQPCSNTLPSVGGINGTGVFATTACAGDTLRFQIPVVDPDSLQSVTIDCDLDIPGATFSVSNASRPVLFFEWMPTAFDVRSQPYRFTVTVRDNACPYNGIQVYSFRIHVDFPSFQLISSAVTCSNSSDGSASVVSANASNESYLWSTGATTSTVQGLSPGTYTVTVSHIPTGCYAQRSIVVDNASPVSAEVTIDHASCPEAQDGAVTVVATGGSAPYQESWYSGTTLLASRPVSSGTYYMHLVDDAGCAFDTTVTIGYDYQLSVMPSVVHKRCKADSSGSISLSPANGQAPFAYVWSTGASTSSLQPMCAGTYSVTVTDYAGCSATLSIPVNEPALSLTLDVEVQSVACVGDSTGRAELFVSGSQGNVSVQWSNGASGTLLTGIPAGDYTATVIDSAGCIASITCQVEQPLHGIAINSTVTPVRCTGDSSGAIAIIPSGGIAPYAIQWSSGETGASVFALTAGVYQVVVTDSNSCSSSESFSVLQPARPLNVVSGVLPSNCLEGLSGRIVLTAEGGTTPYTFAWAHGASDSIVSVPAGRYPVRVVDGHGCSVEREIVVNDLSAVDLIAEGDPLICPGKLIKLTGPSIAGASYQWHFNGVPLIGANQAFFVTSAPGEYTVQVVSACGSFESPPLEIAMRIPPQVSISNDVILCAGESTRLEVSGGSSFLWSPELGLDDAHSASPQCTPSNSTHYTVVVSDEAGCSSSASVMVTILCDEPSVSNGFSPNGDGVNDTFFIDGLDDYPENVIHIYNRWGTLVYKEKPYGNGWNGKSNVGGAFMGQDLPDGTYFYLLDLGMNRKPVQGFVYLKRE